MMVSAIPARSKHYFHSLLRPTSFVGRPAVVRAAKELPPEVVDRRNEVYQELLNHMVLSPEDRLALQARGLSDEAIDRNGYRTLTPESVDLAVGRVRSRFDADDLRSIPGFRVEKVRDPQMRRDWLDKVSFSASHGLLIPVRDYKGRIVSCQVRTCPNVPSSCSRPSGSAARRRS